MVVGKTKTVIFLMVVNLPQVLVDPAVHTLLRVLAPLVVLQAGKIGTVIGTTDVSIITAQPQAPAGQGHTPTQVLPPIHLLLAQRVCTAVPCILMSKISGTSPVLEVGKIGTVMMVMVVR